MENSQPSRPGVIRFAVILFGVLAAIGYSVLLVPALLGRPPNPQAALGKSLFSVAFFYSPWMYRRRPGWEGAFVGFGVFHVASAFGNFASGINPAYH